MGNIFAAVLRRDLALALRRPGDAVSAAAFFAFAAARFADGGILPDYGNTHGINEWKQGLPSDSDSDCPQAAVRTRRLIDGSAVGSRAGRPAFRNRRKSKIVGICR